jgi:SecD/SecF fusion protein
MKVFWKILLSLLFLGYAFWKLLPVSTTPFEEYMETRATVEDPALKTEYRQLLDEAKKRIVEKKSKTLYEALRDLSEGKGDPKGVTGGKSPDFRRYFPDIHLLRDPNIARRNGHILRELLAQSQGKLKLGLDLQGGVSFTLQIDAEKAVTPEEEREILEKAGFAATRGLTDPSSPEVPAAEKAATQAKWDTAMEQAKKDAAKIVQERKDASKSRLNSESLERAIAVMEGRVNAYGVAEPLIRVMGVDKIEIQLPGRDIANNPEAINALKKPAKLEFRMVHRYLRPSKDERENTVKRLRENPNDPSSPNDMYEVLIQRHEVKYGEESRYGLKAGEISETPYYVKTKAEAQGNIVKQARPYSQDSFNWQTSIDFTSEGARVFGKLTGEIAKGNNEQLDRSGRVDYDGKMAIVLDGKLVLAPGVKIDETLKRYRAIAGGAASIDANGRQDAADLSNVLNNPLEFELKLLESRQVSASLAEDAQERSVVAVLVGVALVVFFMLICYLCAGFISVIGLVLNVIITLGLMAAFGATITLPGIAALVLTIGMAVDANILVFERIHEELASGKPLKAAVREGYDMAQATIIDANLTTLMSAAVLIFMGTGSVKGFGVILAIGIVATVFTVLVTCRGLQEFFVNRNIHLPMFGVRFFKQLTHFRFLDVAKPAFAISWGILILCIGALLYKGGDAFSKDFKGGEAITVQIAPGQTEKDPGELVKAATDVGVADVSVTYQSTLGGSGDRLLRIETELSANAKAKKADGTALDDFTQVSKALDAVRAKFPDHFPKGDLNPMRESVGGAVSGSLQKNAVTSMLLALLGIALYVSLRFEPGMGLGAFVSSLHDVLLTAGLYILVGNQFSVSMIAAILMVIGYSINDTIIVFDRIREEMKRHPGMSLRDVVHLSINRTLSRTLLTSLTVFLSAFALWQFGAGDVKEYGLIFVFGVLTGTFSSIFIASPIFYWWHKGQRGSVEKAEAQVRYEWEAGTEVKTKRRDPLAGEPVDVPALPSS